MGCRSVELINKEKSIRINKFTITKLTSIKVPFGMEIIFLLLFSRERIRKCELFFGLFAVVWSPFFSHVKEAWAQRLHPNLLFLFYEDMTRVSSQLVGIQIFTNIIKLKVRSTALILENCSFILIYLR